MVAVVPYASLSVSGFINKIGADAGFAAIIGVALVVIMLFIHARETASLRERAEDAEDRVQYLERAVEQLGRVASQAMQLAQGAQARPGVTAAPAAGRGQTSAQRPVPAPAVAAAYAGGASTSRSVGPPPQLPAAPFGTGGPALSSATRLIPEPGAVSPNGTPSNGRGAAPVPVLAPAVPSATPAAATPAAATPAAVAPAAAAPVAPAPSTAAAGGPGPVPPPPRTPEGRADAAPPRLQPAEEEDRAPRRNYGRGAESRSPRRVLPFLVVVVLVAAIAVAAVLVFGHHHTKPNAAASSNRSHSSTTSGGTKGRKGKHAVTVNPRKVTVAVLNGTTTNHLAADVSSKLGKLGFKQGTTRNFSNQSQTTTTIGFEPGHRAQALAVAKALKVKYSKVLRVNATTQQIVCPAGASCPDQVFVVLGADLTSQA